MLKLLKTSEELLEIFGDIESAGYFDPRVLKDVRVGFSVQHDYPGGIRFKSAINKFGVADNVAAIWVVYESNLATSNDSLVPIRFRIALMSKYRAQFWDYDYDDENCPTKDSVIASSKSPKPLDMDFNDGIFYDANSGKLVDKSLNFISGVEILNNLFEAHCNSVHLIKGAAVRTKLFIGKAPIFIYTKIIDAIVWILKNLFGRTLDESLERITYLDGYEKKNLKVTGDDFIELAGYRAAKPVILLFSVIVFILCLVFFPVKEHTYPANLISSDFILLVHAVLILAILDKFVPNTLFWMVNKLICFRKRSINHALGSKRKTA